MAGLTRPRTFRAYGQRWRIVHERPDTGDNGQCDPSARTIYVAPDLYDRDAIAALYDERFCRMFEFYLAGCELTFRHGGHFVWQMQLAHRADAVPLTRDYIMAAERSEGIAQSSPSSP